MNKKINWRIIIPAILLILPVVLLSSFFIFHDQFLDAAVALREWSKRCSVSSLENILQNRNVHSLLSKVSGVRRGDVCCIFFSCPPGKEKEVLALFPEGGNEGDHFDFMREEFQKHCANFKTFWLFLLKNCFFQRQTNFDASTVIFS